LKSPTIDLKKGMKTGADSDRPKKRPPHLTYSAFCLAARDRTTGFLEWISAAKGAHCLCPVKQKRALLESNPPRDNWIDGDEIKSVSAFGEANTSPNEQGQTFISEPEHALKNSSKTPSRKTIKKYLSWYPSFRSKPMFIFWCLMVINAA
jgi:hypothetical protein